MYVEDSIVTRKTKKKKIKSSGHTYDNDAITTGAITLSNNRKIYKIQAFQASEFVLCNHYL